MEAIGKSWEFGELRSAGEIFNDEFRDEEGKVEMVKEIEY